MFVFLCFISAPRRVSERFGEVVSAPRRVSEWFGEVISAPRGVSERFGEVISTPRRVSELFYEDLFAVLHEETLLARLSADAAAAEVVVC